MNNVAGEPIYLEKSLDLNKNSDYITHARQIYVMSYTLHENPPLVQWLALNFCDVNIITAFIFIKAKYVLLTNEFDKIMNEAQSIDHHIILSQKTLQRNCNW